MITRYFSFKNLRLPLVLAGLLLLLIVGPALSAQVVLLNENFENTVTPFANWDGNGPTNWSIANNTSHSPTHSARANHGSNFLASDNLDASDAMSIQVDFWFRKTDLTTDSFLLYYCYGTTCNQVVALDTIGPDDTWLNYTDTITDTQYFQSNFYLRFEGPPPPGERIFVDDVLITKDTGEILTVSKSGSGSGIVSSVPPGIDCGSDCSQGYVHNTEVTLSAAPDTGSTFTGWSGACTGTGCVVTMDAAKSVTAEFTLNLVTLTINQATGGTITADPASPYHYGDDVTLTATADPGYTFTGWTGDLTGTTNPAILHMDGNKTVSGTFAPNLVTLTINQATGGTITADPAGPYHYGDDVTLTATTDPGYIFTGWTGDLTGTTNPATLHMDGNKTVSATFVLATTYIYLPILMR